jgi:UDP-N-acetylglucosamine 2-epimerase (non-hydrolysing)
MRPHRVILVVGTRPEVIKMAPVVRELRLHPELFEPVVVTTSQHREMLHQALAAFDITPDVDLGLMQPNQGLTEFAARSMAATAKAFAELQADALLVQGDTMTVVTAAFAASYQGMFVGHVEAGLRSFDRENPFPEELNRRLAGVLAHVHFAPTPKSRMNLLNEGVPDRDILVTGNTIVDALQSMPLDGDYEDAALRRVAATHRRLVLITAHRRENQGPRLHAICAAVRRLAGLFEDVEFVFPVHLNPNVRSVVFEELGDVPRVHLLEPLSYGDLLRLMRASYLVLTDSGGIQEEAPSLRKPVLILREVTERPEVVDAGAGRLVGTDATRIVSEASALLTDEREYARMSNTRNPFGDGRASRRIVQMLAHRLSGAESSPIHIPSPFGSLTPGHGLAAVHGRA